MLIPTPDSTQEAGFRGWAAEFCPWCGEVQPFRVWRRSEVFKLAFTTVAETSQGLIVACSECDLVLAGPDNAYSEILDYEATLGRLIERTNSDILDRLANRLEMENRVTTGEASRDERIRIAADRIAAAEHSVPVITQLAEGGQAIDWLLKTGLIVGGVFSFITIASGNFTANHWKVIWVAATALILVGIVYRILVRPGRVARKLLTPAIALALTPLKLTTDELGEAHGLVRKAKKKIAKWISPAAIEHASECVTVVDRSISED